jgi:hypothetical protein
MLENGGLTVPACAPPFRRRLVPYAWVTGMHVAYFEKWCQMLIGGREDGWWMVAPSGYYH